MICDLARIALGIGVFILADRELFAAAIGAMVAIVIISVQRLVLAGFGQEKTSLLESMRARARRL